MLPLTVARGAMREAGDRNVAEVQRVLAALADCCAATNRPDDAAKWRTELQSLGASTRPTSNPSR
jgi:hypothetical protein